MRDAFAFENRLQEDPRKLFRNSHEVLAEIWCCLNEFTWHEKLGEKPAEITDFKSFNSWLNDSSTMEYIEFLISDYFTSKGWYVAKKGILTSEEYDEWWHNGKPYDVLVDIIEHGKTLH